MAGENRELRVVVAVGHRDSRVGWTGDGRADARHDLEGHARGGEFGGFLAAAAEDHRIAAFEAHHGFSGFGFLDDERVDLVLRDRVILGAFAHVDFFAAGLGPLQERGVAQGVVNEHVGAFDEFLGAQRDKTEIAGTGAYEITDSGLAHVRDWKRASATASGSVPRASPD